MTVNIKIRVQAEDFDISEELAILRQGETQIGAIASFIGLVRDINEQENVASLELEHYPGMTEQALNDIAEQAFGRWPLISATIIHRVGKLTPSDQIVLVAVSSMHRGAAFNACEYIMDFLKTNAPFWKKEITPDGERWLDARQSDNAAVERWD